MIEDCRQTGRIDALIALNGRWRQNIDPPSLARVAALRTQCNHLAEATVHGLLDVLQNDTLQNDTVETENEMEQQLLKELIGEADALLRTRLLSVSPDELDNLWRQIEAMATRNDEWRKLCDTLVAKMNDPCQPVPPS